ncbi:hypothetical protein LCGC14_0609030 [marine sediment metagenome]|uniref:Uncharacterized protein n=1 Tax=marine sediment metagenome TaxID=412755 RepID=A0A0F9R8G8_9ZZZZ
MKKFNSYRQTKVNWGKSQANICKLLGRFNITDTRFTFLQSQNKLICEFNYPTEIKEKPVNIGIRIIIPVPESKDTEQAKNQIHRALYYYLKSKFEALEFNLVEFTQEFMPHIVLFDKKGVSRTAYELFEPQYKKNLLTGNQSEIKLIGDGK